MGNLVNTELDSIVAAFNADDEAALMAASGQQMQKKQTGLPRLNINYDMETDDGTSLTRGDWKVYIDGKFLYAPTVILRPILRQYEYSLWDAEEGAFKCKSEQKAIPTGSFKDTEGGNKCGRLSRDEEETASEEALMRSRAVVCNQVIYGQISGDFKAADGTDVTLDHHPVVAYFKRSGFKPISDFISSITHQGKLMQRCNIRLSTSKMKKGSVTYWVPSPTLEGEAQITQREKELMGMFAETVNAHNKYVDDKYREATKQVDVDYDLADDFADADVA